MSAKTRYCVHLRIASFDQIVELRCGQYWVIRRGDVLDLLGRQDSETGKFMAGAYRNRTQRILDTRHVDVDLHLKPLSRGLGVAMAAIPIFACAIFVAIKNYLPLILLGPLTALWVGITLPFWMSRKRRQSRTEQEEGAAWAEALATFRQNLGKVPGF